MVLELAGRHGIASREAMIPAAELRNCEEIWLASSTREVYAVTQLDGANVGTGAPGSHWRRMFELFQQHKAELQTIAP